MTTERKTRSEPLAGHVSVVVMLSLPLYSLCQRYDDIATKVYEDPQSTGDMVELDQFLTTVGLLC